jgi:signal transduction histidine kinase
MKMQFITFYLCISTRLTQQSCRLCPQFTGLGVGLGITRQYCRGIYGGSLSIESMPNHGCDAYLRLERRGNVMF